MNGMVKNLHPKLMAILQDLEDHMGFELTIDSGYRDPEHNKDVGGVEGSEHTDSPANGADVFCQRAVTRYKMLKWLFSYNISRIGIGNHFIHIGIAADKPQDVCWDYYQEAK